MNAYIADIRVKNKELAASLLTDSTGAFFTERQRIQAENQTKLDAEVRDYGAREAAAKRSGIVVEGAQEAHNQRMALLTKMTPELLATYTKTTADTAAAVATDLLAASASQAAVALATMGAGGGMGSGIGQMFGFGAGNHQGRLSAYDD